MCHICGNGVKGDVWGRGRVKRVCGKGAVDLRHGTDVEEILHPCTKGYHSQVRAFYFYLITEHVLMINCPCCKYAFCAVHIVLLCRLKINHVTEIQNMRLFLVPISLVVKLRMCPSVSSTEQTG